MRTLRALFLALFLVVVAAVPASAAPDQSSGREITRYDVTAVLSADGVMQVALDFDFDFGDEPGHGPFLTLPTRVYYDDSQDRAFRYSEISASSSTGAPAQVNREENDNALILRIGDPDIDNVSGAQTYHVEYTVDGLVNPANAQHSGDELYWNVIGAGWEIPLGGLSVQVTGPAAVEGAVCFAGPNGSTDPCTSSAFDGSSSTFTQDLVPVGSEFSTVTGWPAGTFPGVEPILVGKPDPLGPVQPVSPLGIVALLVLIAGTIVAIVRVRRVGRDRAYLGLTPGLRPADNQPGTMSGFRDRRQVVSVQFQPPEGVRPGEMGTLLDESADPVDVTATLVDLAVRGWLRIEEVPRSDPRKKAKDWTLVQLKNRDGSLLPFEDTLLREIFSGSTTVKLSDLRTTFAASMAKVQDGLYDHVTGTGWFRSNPKSVRSLWRAAGIVLVVIGAGLTFFVFASGASVRGLALVPIAIGLIGLLVAALAKAAPARTENGTAVLAQSLGFRRYLATAEANQLKFEEGEDIFSLYLPYAIVFGLADRWARVFAELAAQGRAVSQPGWYVGGYYPGANIYWATAFASSLDRFSSIATESLSAPTPGTSGGSGFSGGFSGGGVGGGGGGGW
ncbi:DUF2207 domain-containing protein [Cellulomonas sp. P5_C6]